MATVVFEDSLTIPPCAALGSFRAWTRSDAFPQHGRIDWVRGAIEVDMSPENLFTHGTLETELAARIYSVVREDGSGEVFIDRTRVTCPEADLSVEPDVVFVSDAAVDSGRARFVAGASGGPASFIEVEGAADLIVEIVSDGSVLKDTERLPRAYHAAGVRELWIVDARTGEPRLEVYRHTTGGYVRGAVDDAGFVRSTVLGRRVRLRATLTSRGLPKYDLDIAAAD